jgi:hypothetical protein
MYVSIRAPDRRTQKLILKSLERGPMTKGLGWVGGALFGATSAASSSKTQPDTVSSSVDNYILISPDSQELFLGESRSTSRKNPGFHVQNV